MVSTINFITSDRTQWTPHFFSEGSWETTLPWQDENFIFECFEQQKENYLHQERDKNFIRNNNTLEKASCNILAPVSFGEKHLLEKAEALITKHQDILERNFKTLLKNTIKEVKNESTKRNHESKVLLRPLRLSGWQSRISSWEKDDKASFHKNHSDTNLEDDFKIAVES